MVRVLKPSRLVPDGAYLFGGMPKYTWGFVYDKDTQARTVDENPLQALRLGPEHPKDVHVYKDGKRFVTVPTDYVLKEFVRECTADLMYLWPNAPDVVRRFVATGNDADAAGDIAREVQTTLTTRATEDQLTRVERRLTFGNVNATEVLNASWAVIYASKGYRSRDDVLWVVETCKLYGIKVDYEDRFEFMLLKAVQEYTEG
jgi:hypothetical protein